MSFRLRNTQVYKQPEEEPIEEEEKKEELDSDSSESSDTEDDEDDKKVKKVKKVKKKLIVKKPIVTAPIVKRGGGFSIRQTKTVDNCR